MSKLFKNKAFSVGFLIGFVSISLVNYYSYLQNRPGNSCDDCGWSFGVPFHLYQEVGFFHIKEILWFGLIADVLFAVIFSFILEFILKFVWAKIQPQKLK